MRRGEERRGEESLRGEKRKEEFHSPERGEQGSRTSSFHTGSCLVPDILTMLVQAMALWKRMGTVARYAAMASPLAATSMMGQVKQAHASWSKPRWFGSEASDPARFVASRGEGRRGEERRGEERRGEGLICFISISSRVPIKIYQYEICPFCNKPRSRLCSTTARFGPFSPLAATSSSSTTTTET
eukprot:751864-Hanusia_phi.AAC.1